MKRCQTNQNHSLDLNPVQAGLESRWSCWGALLGMLLLLAAPGARAQVYAIKSGDIVAANYRAGASTVVRVDPQTGAIRRVGMFNFPTDVAISPEGYLYVSELGGLIKRVNLTNGVETTVNPGTALFQVWGLALGTDGDLFVTTSSSNQIVRINPTNGVGQMSVPTGIDFLDPDHVVVASRANNRVVAVSLLDQTQTVLARGADGIDQPWGLAVFNGNIYVGAHDSRLLFRITGTTVTNILPAVSPKLAGGPFGIGTDLEGNIVIGVSGGLSGPYALERRDPLGLPLPAFAGNYIGEITGVEISRISVVAASQTNTPPVLPVVGELVTDEGAAMAFTADGSDSDWPLQELTYSLQGDVPAGALVSANGVFVWKPDETQGPSTNLFTLVVRDDGIPSMSATQTFTVVVNEVNAQPLITPVGNKVAIVGELLSFKINVTDPDLPAQSLYFSLEADAPPGASISPGGDFNWTPGATPGPGDYIIGVTVTDNGDPILSDTTYFTVLVREVNVAPVFGILTNQSVDEGTLLSYQVTASDTNQPPQNLTFSLASPAPGGAALSSSGLFTWVPGEIQGPGDYLINIRVADDGTPPLSATNSFAVAAREVNRPPLLDPIADQVIDQGDLLAFTVTARDLDLPAQSLTFSLDMGAPAGATISTAGDFRWTPDASQPGGSYVITVRVTDAGAPSLSDERSFTVEVRGGVTIRVGDLIVAAYDANSVVKIDAQTGSTQLLGSFLSPTDVALTANGDLYVSEQGGSIARLDLRAGTTTVVNTNTALSDVRSIALGPLGEIFVASAANDGIYRIDPATGEETLVTQGDLVSGPYGLALLDPEHLVVSSFYNDRLILVALTNNTQYVLAEGNGISQPWGVAAAGGKITFVSFGAQSLQGLNNGVVTNLITLSDPPSGIAAANTGDLAVSLNGAVSEVGLFSPAGTPLTNRPVGLAGFCMGVEVAAFPVGNRPPVLIAIADQVVDEGSQLNFTAVASDPDTPPQALTFTLGLDAPAGALLSPDGLFQWLTTETDGPGTNSFTVTVTDNGTPPLSATQSVRVVVNEVNQAPMLEAITNQAINATSLLQLTLSASDGDAPAQGLTWNLDPPIPAGANLSSGGVFSWVPAANHLPTTNQITVRVTDGGIPPLSAAQSFTVVVNHLPVPASPTLERYPAGGVKVRSALLLGTDPDGDALFLSAVIPVSALGGTVSTNAGWVIYTPPAGVTNQDSFGYTVGDGRSGFGAGVVNVVVTTNAGPSLNLTWSDLPGGQVRLRGSGIPQRNYLIEYTESLLTTPAWHYLGAVEADALGLFEYLDQPPAGAPSRYYRAISP
jgi:sugar lactone lactonase YvrE